MSSSLTCILNNQWSSYLNIMDITQTIDNAFHCLDRQRFEICSEQPLFNMKMFNCDVCGRKYGSKQALTTHSRTKHNPQGFSKTKSGDSNSFGNENIETLKTNPTQSDCLNKDFLKLKRLEDYQVFIKKDEKNKISTLGCLVDHSSIFNQIAEDLYQEVYGRSKKYCLDAGIKNDFNNSGNWSNIITHLGSAAVSNSHKFSLLEFIGGAYLNTSSSVDVSVIAGMKNGIKIEQDAISKITGCCSIDDAIVNFYFYNKLKLSHGNLLFVMRVLCLLREFINLRFYLIYGTLGYSSSFSPEVLPQMAFQFFCHLLVDDLFTEIKCEIESFLFLNQSDYQIIKDILKQDKRMIFQKSLPDQDALIGNYSRFMEIVKPRVIKAGRKSSIPISSTSEQTKQSNEEESSEKEKASLHNRLRTLLTINTKFSFRDLKEVFFTLDYFCLWMNKNNYSEERFCKD